ncbi:symmetrical bis(5'-nucleosyl)-tetraphosphatase [Legionella israelensis]|uniref:Bis(5'-nucleosyl)-tetraphosphatase, symmetrical n=1 Tax=Legionella israelensis TaxID=454 RepID=A0AAX1EDF5_9GAMM|nr:symmetrical bis(5'-nucleosyl)-tetraphosphatase [Legionella israelensis]QBR83135.1 symmetrical bis(5'-nucleosyl)-tetraphosphatase [Legionella israelensis]
MVDYAIGDIQGCYDALQRLLERIDFNEKKDQLWLVGDLVNRGPQSLEVLRFIKGLPLPANITLGNHDLHLLGAMFGGHPWRGKDDTIGPVLAADDAEDIGHWLRHQALLIHSETFNLVMSHAGIAPLWNLAKAKKLAREMENVLQGEGYIEFLKQMYGNEPDIWSDTLTGMDRLRVITNYFTRMRFCDANGRLLFGYKGTIAKAPSHFYPWYEVPHRCEIEEDIVFGHWAALEGKCLHPKLYPIDTGCLWGGELTALRLHDRKRFTVPGLERN